MGGARGELAGHTLEGRHVRDNAELAAEDAQEVREVNGRDGGRQAGEDVCPSREREAGQRGGLKGSRRGRQRQRRAS